MANRKLHMRFRLAPKSMTLDDLELLQVRISRNFALLRIFGRPILHIPRLSRAYLCVPIARLTLTSRITDWNQNGGRWFTVTVWTIAEISCEVFITARQHS